MREELLFIYVNVPAKFNDKIYNTTLVESFVAPSFIVRAFADFLSCREEEETFTMRNIEVPFLECSVTVGETPKAVSAYECLSHYDMPLNTHSICQDLINSTELGKSWKKEHNYIQFSNWFKTRTN